MKVLIFYCALIFSFFLLTGCSGDESTPCSENVTLQSYEQDGYKLILNYKPIDVAVEASITSGSANPDDGIILPVNSNVIDFSQAGLAPGNYGLYLRTVCSDGNRDWGSPIPIVINEVCDATMPAISFIQYDVNLFIITNGSVYFPVEIRFRPDNGEDIIVRINYLDSSGRNLYEKGIEPGHYISSLRGICTGNAKTAWSEGVELNITDYHCLKPNSFGVYNSNNEVDVAWSANSDYNQWEYVYLNEGDSISTGQIISTTQQGINGLPTSVGKDLFVRGVCGENTYTDWAQAF